MNRYLGANGALASSASRLDSFRREGEHAFEQGRVEVADLISADRREIVCISGATESDKLAIEDAFAARAAGGRRILASAIEHKAVLDFCLHLERNGFETITIEPRADGLTTPGLVELALRDDTTPLSLIHVNNEVGTITDITSIRQLARNRAIPFHVDPAQSAARLWLDMWHQHVDLRSISGHKMFGPKDVAALYVRHRLLVPMQPQIHGGGHGRGPCSDTVSTHQIAAIGEVAHLPARRATKMPHIASAQPRH